jgi:dolichol-phosphate mannosyltransferase
MYDLTVIIPTFNEESNIRNIIMAVDAVFHEHALNGQILVVDDKSSDRTISVVNDLKRTHENVDILVREHDHGLSQSVADGFSHAASEIFIVIDADFSHPPALIPRMYEEIRKGNDIVIGSRYMKGGGIKKWPLRRKVISTGATFLGRLLFPEISDPVSGFFAIRKSVLTHTSLKPRGYKILLEVLGKGIWENDIEIPFEFVDREIGSSKLRVKTILDYIWQVTDITLYSFTHHGSAAWREWKKIFKFGIVGISGILVNESVLIYLKEFIGFSIPVANLFSIELAILNNFLWNDLWTFKSEKEHKLSRRWFRLTSFHLVSAGGAVINFSIVNFFPVIFGLGEKADYRILNILGILTGFIWNFMVNRRVTWTRK